ncbi:UNVERIFIED_ORG: hypothetical protein J2Y78_004944 [Buttiauxella agrestis ATCC 33320]
MKTYRLTFSLQGKLVGNLDCSGIAGEELISKLEQIVHQEMGWSITRWVSDGEKRILESTPKGIRLISSEKIFRQVDNQCTFMDT